MRGLSLLEVVIACLLLTLSVFFTLTVFTGVLRASNYSDERQDVVAVLEVLGDYFRRERHQNWATTRMQDVTGTFEGFTYNVIDNGLIMDPLATARERGTGTARELQMRTLTIEVLFTVRNAVGVREERMESSVVSVPR